jgi:hypothetical protein
LVVVNGLPRQSLLMVDVVAKQVGWYGWGKSKNNSW